MYLQGLHADGEFQIVPRRNIEGGCMCFHGFGVVVHGDMHLAIYFFYNIIVIIDFLHLEELSYVKRRRIKQYVNAPYT